MAAFAFTRSLSLFACALAMGSAVACGGGGDGSGEAPAATVREQKPLPEEPLVARMESVGHYGGRFVLGQTNGPKTFNAMMANETSSTDITGNLFVGLADFDNETQQDTPALATRWELAPDGLTWTFHLRKGAAFSDGHPITSADVLFSFQLAYDETLHPSVQDLLVTNGQKWQVSAPDEHTFVIKLPSPNAMVVPLAGSVRIMPRHVLEPVYKAGNFASAYNVSTPSAEIVGSGPWRLKQYAPGEKTVLEPNPYWYGVDRENKRLPYLDELVFLEVPDQDAADLKFRAGQIDGLDNVKPENYQWYAENQQQGNYTLYDLGPALTTNFFWFNLNVAQKAEGGRKVGDPYVDPVKYSWFSNPVFRRAVSMAVDREAMIPSIFFGDAVKNWSTSTPGSKVWFTPDVVKYDFNLDEAKRLLAGLGWKDGNGDGVIEDTQGRPVSFTLKTNSDNKMRVGMANFIRDDLAKIGIRVTLVPVDFNTLVTNIRDDKQYDALLLGLQSGVPPDPAMGQNVWRSSGRTHYWNISQPKPATPEEAKIDALMDTIVASADLTVRKQAWKDVQNIVNGQAWIIWLPTINAKIPMRNRFGNAKPSVIPHRLIWNIDRVYIKQSRDRPPVRTYVLRRFLQMIPLLFGISALTFMLLQLAPGDFLNQMAENPAISPATIEAMRRRFGLDQPWYVQYGLYLRNVVLHFDFGESFSRHQPVFTVIREGLGNTLILAVAAAIVTWGLALPLGIWAAVRQYSWIDKTLSLVAFIWLSIPEILSGLLLLMIAARTGWFPVGGMRSIDYDEMSVFGKGLDLLWHLALPALVVGLVPLASRMRQMRGNLLDVLRLDYVTTARSKGLDERVVIYKHALRNALNPMITLFGYTLGALVSGSFVAEIIFSWPGLGRLTLDAILTQDQYLVMGSVLMASVVLILGNLIADLLLAIADPRISYD